LDKLRKIGGDFWVNTSNDLIDFTGLEQLEYLAGNFMVDDNDTLQNFSGLSALQTIAKTFRVGGVQSWDGNHAIKDFSGLESLTTINGELWIENNHGIMSLEGLNNLDYVYGSVILDDNDALQDLSGLSSLSNCNNMSISWNDSLTTLAGLSSSLEISNSLIIQQNPMLSTCDVESVCNYLSVSSENAFISYNADGCATVPEVVEACGATGTSDASLLSFNIYPNPTYGLVHMQSPTADQGTVKIFEVKGNLVSTFENFNMEQSLDLSFLAPGLYLVECTAGQKTGRKLVVRR
jgi:hypothetical protein